MEDSKRKVAIYIRVSTAMQVDKDSLPMQRKDLAAYSELILGTDDYIIFEDAGYSGKDTDRPKYQEMMSRVRRREFSHVLVWKIDRISRNLIDFAEMYTEFKKYHVTFISKHEQFDTSTAIGEAMLKIILVFAELERQMTAERVTATMISRASSGIWNGGRIPFGYDYDKEEKLFSINEDEAKVCRLIRDDYMDHNSLIHTASLLNSLGYRTKQNMEWSPNAVWHIASSPFYAGIYRYNRRKGVKGDIKPEKEWVYVKDHHPAIFTEEEHEALKNIRESNRRNDNTGVRHKPSEHVFANLAFCGKCGAKMYATPGRKHADGSRSTNYSCRMRRTGACDNSSTTDTIIGEFVINYVLNVINAKKSFSKISTEKELEECLLYGSTFADVKGIDPECVHELFTLLSRYKSDGSFKFALKDPRKKKEASPELSLLRKEKEKNERALKRLQDLYLYSDNAISEADYIIRRKEITERIKAVNESLGMMQQAAAGSVPSLSDEDFIRKASHLLIQKQLKNRVYIYYRKLSEDVSKEVLSEYMESILDSVYVTDSHVGKIVFKNGLVQAFRY